MKILEILAADFETTTTKDKEKFKTFEPQVYSWGVKGEKFPFTYGINISSFFDMIKKLDKDYIMFFHNGAKFDFHFIISKLNENGFKQKKFKSIEENKSKIVKIIKYSDYYNENTFTPKNKKDKYEKAIRPNEYQILVNNNFAILEIKIGLKSLKTTNGQSHNRALIIEIQIYYFHHQLKNMVKH